MFAGLDLLRKRLTGAHKKRELTIENCGLTRTQIDVGQKALKILGFEDPSKLSKHDVIIFLYAVGLNPTDDVLDSKFRLMNVHTNEQVTFAELCHIWHSMLQDLTDEEEILKRAFQFFDKDGNGEISVNELRNTMRELGDLLTEEEIAAFMECMDVNNDGVIGYQEFLDTLKTQAPDIIGAEEEYFGGEGEGEEEDGEDGEGEGTRLSIQHARGPTAEAREPSYAASHQPHSTLLLPQPSLSPSHHVLPLPQNRRSEQATLSHPHTHSHPASPPAGTPKHLIQTQSPFRSWQPNQAVATPTNQGQHQSDLLQPVQTAHQQQHRRHFALDVDSSSQMSSVSSGGCAPAVLLQRSGSGGEGVGSLHQRTKSVSHGGRSQAVLATHGDEWHPDSQAAHVDPSHSGSQEHPGRQEAAAQETGPAISTKHTSLSLDAHGGVTRSQGRLSMATRIAPSPLRAPNQLPQSSQ